MPITRCEYEGCQREAVFAPKLFVPPVGYIGTEQNSVALVLGLKTCRTHCENLELEEFLNEKIRQLIELMVKMRGSVVPPNFAAAWIKPLRLDSAEYKLFANMKDRQ